MTRPALLAALAILAAPVAAMAADTAEHRILGFSPDAAIFAFEEFGVQDGSGFPYANIFVIDTEADAWVPGSPFRVTIEDETATLAEARAQASDAAASMLADAEIEDRWRDLAASPLGEFEADPTEMRFGLPKLYNPLDEIEERFEAAMDIYHAETPGQDCEAFMGQPASGFRLRLGNLGSGTETVLHEDETVPRSRGCPITYRLTRVVVPDTHPVETVVVLVSVLRHGFEGADRRFMAVTGALPD